MIKGSLCDCGGVFVATTTGDWVLGPEFETILGGDFIQTRLNQFREVRGNHYALLPDTQCVATDEAEYSMFIDYYRTILTEMGISLTQAQLEKLAYLQTYRDDRYILFDDVLPYLEKWQKQYTLGIVSDAPPSTRRILKTAGVMDFMSGATFSCDLGVLKPDPRIYQSTLDQLGVTAGEAVFIDDFPSKLRGAHAIGIRTVQMRRPMPAAFKLPPEWDAGPLVHAFAEFDAVLKDMA